MKFMIPLGFIAILSVAILVVIYLIKPSYKSKTLPSTYIWKESLKYRKKDKNASLKFNYILFRHDFIEVIKSQSRYGITPCF